MIEAQGLTKRYGAKTAVDGIAFVVQPGKVTGFLGPNGAGKSTTMRMIVGLDAPTSGRVTVGGSDYRGKPAPLREVGVLLEAKAVHTGRTARNHLRALAATHGIPASRVDEVIGLAGLEAVASKRVGGFSLGMGQRLGIAAALLGDPQVVILDEPVNGLDPEGVRWMRLLMRRLAAEGRTVLLSSHLMSEMSQTADHLIVLGRGRVLADAPVDEVIARAPGSSVRVRAPDLPRLAAVLGRLDVTLTPLEDGAVQISGTVRERIGEAAAAAGVVLHELTTVMGSLEDAYLDLTHDEVEYRAEMEEVVR
ncbi:ABC transporter ATP-binding protein [Microbacterium paludicola]|uniref:ABC transporter ATP-binding protein n=1 Tax=Microbacterium paludicola TaxID=300019 RepID=A0A4Y9FPU4_9MICO|nr:ABC transporter ATP-binding protein [Microbacterium paludicola]MBF0817445.1 ABC transporter ATP-binding protein [Microbacterium paludicola]TFU31191.1 ABC transporter ATP-binding protein [Microbacterium paludicola]